MSFKSIFILFCFSLIACSTKPSDREICFGNLKSRIGSDSILKKMMYSPFDSFFWNFAPIMDSVVKAEVKSDSICSICIDKFFRENHENSRNVNTLIILQQFQAYLRHEKFNQSKAKEIALE